MENKRFAIDIGVTLSGNLINACLSMLAIIGAIFIFIIEKRTTSIIFYILIFLSFSSFILSIIFGGKGINIARQKAFKNKLKLNYSKKHFNNQAVTCLLGIISCLVSIAFTSEKVETNIELININKNIKKLIDQKEEINLKNDSLKLEIKQLKKRLEKIELKK